MKTQLKKLDNLNLDSDLVEIEKVLRCKLPLDYKEYLKRNVELYPENLENEVYVSSEFSDITFGYLYGSTEVLSKYHEYDYFDNGRIDLYNKTLLIGEEYNNGYFFLQVLDENTYKIGFWDHDYVMSEYQDEDDDELINERMNPHNVYYLADSLNEFLNFNWNIEKFDC